MKWFKKHKIFTALLLVLLVLVGTVVGYVWSKLSLIQYETENDQTVDPSFNAMEDEGEQLVNMEGLVVSETIPAIPETDIEHSDDIVNILVLGTDDGTAHMTEAARSDSMILVSINKTDNTVKLVSLERGMGVPVLEGEYEGQYDWLTHIFRYGGAELTCKTVEHCFRVEVDHYVRVNFITVRTVVDAIGGIDIELSEDEAWALSREKNVYMAPGMNHLNGDQALSFARLRYIDSDWYRVERQRKVILAAVDALKGSSLKELNDLLDQVLPMIRTDMSMLEIADLMLYAPNFLSSTFDQMTIPKAGTFGGMMGMGGRGLFAVDFEVNSQILRDFLYGTGEAEQTTAPTE